MSITANLIDDYGYVEQTHICDFQIDSDDDFAEVVTAAEESAARGVRCAIQWTRIDDGQVGYWGPKGATLRPHWFKPTPQN